jgi:hypothetical protein
LAGEEIKLMRRYFFNKMNEDTAFRTAFGTANIAARIGQPFAAQGSLYPLINIRKFGNASFMRPQNSAQDYVLVRQDFLIVAINDIRAYPDELAELMQGLFRLQQSLAVTGGRILECFIAEPGDMHEDQYKDSAGKMYSEKGTMWTIAAKAD